MDTSANTTNHSGAIEGFDVNASTGALTPMAGSPFPTPGSGQGMAITGGFLYAASGGGDAPFQITSYQIGPTGALTQVSSTPTGTELISYGLRAHNSGKFLYASTNSGDIVGYQITSPGHLAAISGTPQSLHAESMALSPDGKWGFVSYFQTSGGGPHIYSFAINSSTGAWSGPNASSPGVGNGVQPPQAGRQPTDIHLVVDPTSTYLLVAVPYANLVYMFRIGSDGSLSAVGNANGTKTPGAWPFSLTATASAAYFGDFNGATISGFSLTSGGLTPTPGSPYANTAAPAYNMGVAPGEHLLYVINNDPGNVTVYNIAADGSLSQISGSPFTTPTMFGANPSYVAFQ